MVTFLLNNTHINVIMPRYLAGREAGAAEAGLTVRVSEGCHHDVPELVHVPLPDDPGQLVPRLRHLLINTGPEVKSIIILDKVSFVDNLLVDRLLADLLPHEITDDAPDDWRPRIGQYGSRDRFTGF